VPPSARPTQAVAGGVVSKLAPSGVQLLLLLFVARRTGLDDVGRLALASAVAFLCGNLAEVGTMTSLSLPDRYFGVAEPPLRATRDLRWGAAAAGSVLYGLLWAAGLGSHETVFLVALALPALLAVSFGYAGALNATGALALEGWISLAESGLIVGLAFAFFAVWSPVAAALAALSIGRLAGTIVRAAAVRRRPQSDAQRIAGATRSQLGFLATSAAIVVEGQADVVVLGFVGTFTLLGVYGPLIRACYATFLVAEGLSLALYSLDESGLRRWRRRGLAAGVVAAIAFFFFARPLLDFVLSTTLHHLLWPVALLAILIPVRFYGYLLGVDLVRAGRQLARVPALLVGTAILVAGAIVGWRTGSLTWLAGFRLVSEVAIAVGFLYARAAIAPRTPGGGMS
jgi:O-antigen/teichoic acid export membrane protein